MDDTILGEIIRARDGRPSVGNWVKGGSRLVNISRQVDNITGHNLPEEGELRNTAVFKLHILGRPNRSWLELASITRGSSMARSESLVSSSKVSQPKPRVPLQKPPGYSDLPVTSFITERSRVPTKSNIWMIPSSER